MSKKAKEIFKSNKFGIRKFTIGVSSILIGSTMYLGLSAHNEASAAEESSAQTQSESQNTNQASNDANTTEANNSVNEKENVNTNATSNQPQNNNEDAINEENTTTQPETNNNIEANQDQPETNNEQLESQPNTNDSANEVTNDQPETNNNQTATEAQPSTNDSMTRQAKPQFTPVSALDNEGTGISASSGSSAEGAPRTNAQSSSDPNSYKFSEVPYETSKQFNESREPNTHKTIQEGKNGRQLDSFDGTAVLNTSDDTTDRLKKYNESTNNEFVTNKITQPLYNQYGKDNVTIDMDKLQYGNLIDYVTDENEKAKVPEGAKAYAVPYHATVNRVINKPVDEVVEYGPETIEFNTDYIEDSELTPGTKETRDEGLLGLKNPLTNEVIREPRNRIIARNTTVNNVTPSEEAGETPNGTEAPVEQEKPF